MGTSDRWKGGDGPDWEDVRQSVLAVNRQHQVFTTITVMPDGSRRGHLLVVVCATPDGLEPTLADAFDRPRWATTGSLPTQGRDSFSSRVWGLVIELDVLLSVERWTQTRLPEG